MYCNSNKDLGLDHLTSRSRGGTNHYTNLVTCCNRCNFERGDTPLATFIGCPDTAKKLRAYAKNTPLPE